MLMCIRQKTERYAATESSVFISRPDIHTVNPATFLQGNRIFFLSHVQTDRLKTVRHLELRGSEREGAENSLGASEHGSICSR